MEFKVGDRVRYVVQRDIDNVKVGEVGIIRGISPYGNYAVDFEESGYKHNCDGLCQSNHGWWCSGDTLEPVDSKTLRMADGTVIGEFAKEGIIGEFKGIPVYATGGTVSIHDLDIASLYRPMNINVQPLELVCNEEKAKEIAERLNKELTKHFNAFPNNGISAKNGGKNSMKFTFYVKEGTRVDKTCNKLIPTMTTTVEANSYSRTAPVGTATCDKADYDMRQGVLEALANMYCDGDFGKVYNKAVKRNELADKKKRTCKYCGKIFDTAEEREAEEAWHVERKKARRERYLLRKRAKEIAFEEQAQKMAKEIAKENK